MVVNLFFHIIGALFVILQEVWTQNEQLFTRNVSSSKYISYQNLCMNECICGQLFHPLHSLVNGNRSFARYDNGRWTDHAMNSMTSQWFLDEIMIQKIHFPANIVFCQMLSLQHPPKIEVNNTVEENDSSFFLTHLNVIIFTQGNLTTVDDGDLMENEHFLEFLDLSNNKLKTFSSRIFSFTRLKFVDLRHNCLKQIEIEGGFAIKSGLVNRPILRIKGNPLICLCHLAQLCYNYVIIPDDDYSYCISHSNSCVAQNFTSECVRSISGRKDATQLLFSVCQKNNTTTSFAKQSQTFVLSDPHHDIQKPPIDGDRETSGKGITITELIDIPLLVTMAAWFLMLYVGITKFVKANAVDYETHAKYIHSLGSDRTYRSMTHPNCISDIAAHQSYKIVSNTLKLGKSS